MLAGQKHKFQFGPYQLDTECGQLHNNGLRLKLQGQPIQILELLLENRGELVTREEIRQRLWSADTFVDFDHSLNAAIQRLRQALGDEADTPRYIETVPKRGYRFIGEACEASQPTPVTQSGIGEGCEHRHGAVSAIASSVSIGAEISNATMVPARPSPGPAEWALPGKSHARRGRRLAYGTAFLAATALLCAVLLVLRSKHDLRQPRIVQFTSLPGFESRPSFAPDGNQIVFASMVQAAPDIYVKAIGDEKVLRLTEPPGSSRRPQWSPDGRTIAYDHWTATGTPTLGHAIFIMTPLGGSKRKIRELSEASDGLTSWSPDSKLLALDDKPTGEGSGIFLIPASGGLAQRLTSAPDRMFDGSPAFSPDGESIAFVRTSDEGGSAEVHLVSVSDHGEKRLATLDRSVSTLAWTPDGKQIVLAVTGFFLAESALYLLPATGGEAQRLTIISSDASWPAISPRGDKLAYVTSFFDSNIWKVSLRDSGPPNPVLASSRMEMQASYSPDGKRLAYVSNRDGTLAIWTSSLDGADQARLVSVPAGGGTPVWSPDGKQIAFDSNEGGHWNILLMEADGTNPVRLTDESSDHRGPSWSADGQFVYYTCNRSDTWEIWKTSVRSSKPVQVTFHGGSYAQESPDGKFVYYQKPKFATRFDFPMPPVIWRMPVAGGLEEVVWRGEDSADDSWFWHVTGNGIYFVDNAGRPKPALKFLDLKTRSVHIIRELYKPAWGGPGLAISPDEQTALIAQIDASGSDIMIAENFR